MWWLGAKCASVWYSLLVNQMSVHKVRTVPIPTGQWSTFGGCGQHNACYTGSEGPISKWVVGGDGEPHRREAPSHAPGCILVAAIGQVWTRHRRSSCACPTVFIAFSVPRVFLWLSAQFAFHWCPCPFLPGWGQGYKLLGSGLYRLVTTTLGPESRLWRTFRVPCLVPLVRRPCSLVLASPGHTPYTSCLPGHGGLTV